MKQADSVSFARVLARREVLALSFGAMIGFSWVILTDNWILEAGTGGAVLAFALGGIAILFIGLAYSELAAAMPLVGGEHVYSYRAMGDLGSFICTWAILLGYVSVAAFESVAFPTILESLLGQNRVTYLWTVSGWDVYLSWALVGVAGSIVIAWINVRGVKLTTQVQTAVTTVIIVAGLALFIGAPLNGDPANIQIFFNNGFAGFAGVLVLVPILFVGFDVIPQAAEEIDLPRNTIGRLLMISVILAVLFYIFVILAVGLRLDATALANTDVGTAEAAAVALITIYLPGMPAALLWPHEWIIILAWAVAGSLMYSRARSIYGPADPGRILRRT